EAEPEQPHLRDGHGSPGPSRSGDQHFSANRAALADPLPAPDAGADRGLAAQALPAGPVLRRLVVECRLELGERLPHAHELLQVIRWGLRRNRGFRVLVYADEARVVAADLLGGRIALCSAR